VRFSDLIPGFVIRTSPRLVTAKEMVEFASRFDSQWFHVDERVDSKRVAQEFCCRSRNFGTRTTGLSLQCRGRRCLIWRNRKRSDHHHTVAPNYPQPPKVNHPFTSQVAAATRPATPALIRRVASYPSSTGI